VTNEEWAEVIYRALGVSLRAQDKRHSAILALENKATGIALRRDLRDTAERPQDLGRIIDTLLGQEVQARLDEILTKAGAPEEIARQLGGGNDVVCEVYRQVILDVKRLLVSPGMEPPSPPPESPDQDRPPNGGH
jgi:hypothetical protein